MTIPSVNSGLGKERVSGQGLATTFSKTKTRSKRGSERRRVRPYKPYYDEPVIEFILNPSYSTSLESQGYCNAGNGQADGACGDDVWRHVVLDVQFLILEFGERGDGSHVVWKCRGGLFIQQLQIKKRKEK